MRQTCLLSTVLTTALGLLILSPAAQSKDKKKAPPKAQDEIEVVGHIAPVNGSVTRFLTTQHYSSYYLYVERDGGKNVTLVDITKTSQPLVLADIPAGSNAATASVFAAAGTAALVTDQAASAPASAPQNVRIMDYSDPKNPKIAREFAGVTAVSRDDSRGLIFLANPEGIWILHQKLAEDPEKEEEYARYVLYYR
jgi:hypothetical protein